MNCIIIEDQLPAQRILKKYIEDTGSMTLVGVYSNAIEALQALKTLDVDLMFLDIHLPKMSGMDLLESLTNPPEVIITTAFQDYALQSYEFNVVDYLLKPFSFQRFIKAISKVGNTKRDSNSAMQDNNPEKPKEIYIKDGFDHYRVVTDTIFYITSDSDYSEIHLEDKKLLSSESLKYWEDMLAVHKFARIHKSYIINTDKIEKVSGNKIVLKNKAVLPIGRVYKNEFSKQYLNL